MRIVFSSLLVISLALWFMSMRWTICLVPATGGLYALSNGNVTIVKHPKDYNSSSRIRFLRNTTPLWPPRFTAPTATWTPVIDVTLPLWMLILPLPPAIAWLTMRRARRRRKRAWSAGGDVRCSPRHTSTLRQPREHAP